MPELLGDALAELLGLLLGLLLLETGFGQGLFDLVLDLLLLRSFVGELLREAFRGPLGILLLRPGLGHRLFQLLLNLLLALLTLLLPRLLLLPGSPEFLLLLLLGRLLDDHLWLTHLLCLHLSGRLLDLDVELGLLDVHGRLRLFDGDAGGLLFDRDLRRRLLHDDLRALLFLFFGSALGGAIGLGLLFGFDRLGGILTLAGGEKDETGRNGGNGADFLYGVETAIGDVHDENSLVELNGSVRRRRFIRAKSA